MTAALIIVIIVVMSCLFINLLVLMKLDKAENEIYKLRDEIWRLRKNKPIE